MEIVRGSFGFGCTNGAGLGQAFALRFAAPAGLKHIGIIIPVHIRRFATLVVQGLVPAISKAILVETTTNRLDPVPDQGGEMPNLLTVGGLSASGPFAVGDLIIPVCSGPLRRPSATRVVQVLPGRPRRRGQVVGVAVHHGLHILKMAVCICVYWAAPGYPGHIVHAPVGVVGVDPLPPVSLAWPDPTDAGGWTAPPAGLAGADVTGAFILATLGELASHPVAIDLDLSPITLTQLPSV
mmetsp:Transcript_31885/g.69784  ORF Transcript_31885/g.69784 Transcript_31885/m.69784 type:complete len:239 (+) Transcript_31885:172-888(+)